MARTRVHIVRYTHWDREFRWEFERTRMRLVDCLDHLLDIMESDPDYKSFMLDGQFTLVEDYLEIRPEKRATIERLVREGRLEAGPWFTLPDCAPVNGESVVRNLAYGLKRADQCGGAMRCGYNVFSFGQIAQLPQIYAQFGIDTIIFYKYMDASRTKYPEFIWEGPDGTRALASRLGPEARWNFFFAGHIPIMYDRDPWHKEWRYTWGDLGKVFHTADPEGRGWFYEILDPETAYHPTRIKEGMERTLKTVQSTAMPESVLFFDGTDFTEPHPLSPQVYAEIQKLFPDHEIIQSRLGDYLAELREKLQGRKDLDVVRGAMRDGPVGAVHTDVMSVHPEMLIENSHAENTLLRWAEPLSTIAWAHGISSYPATYLEKIWRLLFQSHAHDSLHGLGPVTLAEGELGRLKQAHVISKGLLRKGLENITKEIDTSGIEGSEYFLAVHNPSAVARTEVVEAYVDVPADVQLKHVVIEDLDGNPVAVQEAGRQQTRAGVYHPRSRNMPFYCTKVHIYFEAANVPAMGHKVFKLKWEQKNEYPYPHEDWDPPRILADSLLSGPNQAENDLVRVRANADGTFDLTDKATGHVYPSLNYFLDQGETGNMWMSDPPANDAVIRSLGQPAQVAIAASGPLAVVFDVRQTLHLPASYDWTAQRRSEATVAVPVQVRATLRKGQPYLEVETEIDNRARDHYLKVCFPTGLQAEKTWAEGAFTVTEFPVAPGRNGELRGPALARHPAQLWFDLFDGKKGLAVLSDAAKDYEVLEHDETGTLAMGLVRGVRLRIPCDNRLWMEYPGDESAQSLRPFRYRYALQPHTKMWDKAGLYPSALAFNTPLRACQFGRQEGQFPAEHSFLSLDGDSVVLSAVKKADERDAVIVRFFNPTGKDAKATLRVALPVKQARLLKLSEEPDRDLKLKDGVVEVPAPKGAIVTVELTM